MSTELNPTLSQFFGQRTESLFDKFTGRYRAVVVETNDPLRMYRVRFKIPELHDWGLRADQCPWAVASHDAGAYRSGRWSHPCIGDWVWIEFEKNHPYGPVWTGFATPTRRKMYPYPSLYGATPIPVDREGNISKIPQDYAVSYMPKDGRPMTHGWQDRYGNLDIHSSVGFYPIVHASPPAGDNADSLSQSNFNQSKQPPQQNSPDSKFMARISKYGNIILQSDMGYIWQDSGLKFKVQGGGMAYSDGDDVDGEKLVESDSGSEGKITQYSISVTSVAGVITEVTASGIGEFTTATKGEAEDIMKSSIISLLREKSTAYNMQPVPLLIQWASSFTAIPIPLGEAVGEFTGNFVTDEQYEINRWQYYQRLVHEDRSSGVDQRRIMLLTRYGHKLEMRDVGWNSSREGEFTDEAKHIGSGRDQRWFKLRTKGGHLIELSDIGFDSIEDEFTKRHLIDEISNDVPLDQEDKFGDDARFIRFVTRSGIKFGLDDRTSHKTAAHEPSRQNKDIGTGVLIKGRATPGTKCDGYANKSGDPRGYFWEIDERPEKNSTAWGTPKGQIIELDDNNESIIICSRLPDKPEAWHHLDDLEFMQSSVGSDIQTAINTTHHLAINHSGEWIRLKSRAGNGDSSVCKTMGDASSGVQQGLEIHDAPTSNPWVELVDIDNRGMWFSKQHGIGIWRARDQTDIHVWLDDADKKVIIRNNVTSGKIQIFCAGDIEVRGDDISIHADQNVNIRAGNTINMEAGGGRFRFAGTAFDTNSDVRGRNILGYFPQIRQGSGRPPGSPSGSGGTAGPIQPEDLPAQVSPDNRL